MISLKIRLAGVVAVFVVTACARDSNKAMTDSSAADSIRDAHSAPAADGSAASESMTGSPVDTPQPPINSTAGTIGETRKISSRDTLWRDSVIHGPYKTMDSLGQIKR